MLIAVLVEDQSRGIYRLDDLCNAIRIFHGGNAAVVKVTNRIWFGLRAFSFDSFFCGGRAEDD